MALGPLVVDIAGTTLTYACRTRLCADAVGGVILFTRNYQSKAQLIALVREIRALRQPELIIMVDHEGGTVQRFREGFTAIPSMATLGALYEQSATQALTVAEAIGWVVANELLAVGIDLSLAPIVDINWGRNRHFKSRQFHHDPAVVTALAKAFITGHHRAGMAVVAKHFPGHGYACEDSHYALPVDPRDLETLMRDDMAVFQQLFDCPLDAVMTAHVTYPSCSSEIATFSHFWCHDILRERLGFKGVVLSDDLTMQAATGCDLPNRVHNALTAGCDAALVCNHESAVDSLLNTHNSLISNTKPEAHHARLATLRARVSSATAELEQSKESWYTAQSLIKKANKLTSVVP